jgi:hypothetical protein
MQRRWTVGGALALLLSVTALASAQDAGAPAAPAPPATTIIVVPTPPPPAGTAPAPAATASAAAPAPVARPMSEQPPVYRPAPARARKAAPVRPILGPVATYPGFRMLDGGASRVFVSVNRNVEVTEHKAEGRVTYRLKGVAAPVRTNRLPLLTNFFPTPVGRVQLVEQGADVDVVIDLRMPSSSQHRVLQQNGGILLQVDFPRPAGLPAAAAPSAAAAPPTAKRTQNTTTIRGGSSD